MCACPHAPRRITCYTLPGLPWARHCFVLDVRHSCGLVLTRSLRWALVRSLSRPWRARGSGQSSGQSRGSQCISGVCVCPGITPPHMLSSFVFVVVHMYMHVSHSISSTYMCTCPACLHGECKWLVCMLCNSLISMLRPYHGEKTDTHQHIEVNHH